MFDITENAAQQIVKAAEQSGTNGMGLRLAARTNADGTVEYLMGFDEAGDDDITTKIHGVEVVMAPEYVPILDQTTLDFVELESGDLQFVFINPKDANYSAPSQN